MSSRLNDSRLFLLSSVPSKDDQQLKNEKLATFLNDCSIQHITSDPMYPQSNGFAESMVKVMKNLITKVIASNKDPNWALLAYRATPP